MQVKKRPTFLSFYDVTEESAIVFGLFTFGFIVGLTHEMRDFALVLDGFFVVGFLLLISLLLVEF
jgi:UMF1 family MFS transporter